MELGIGRWVNLSGQAIKKGREYRKKKYKKIV